MVTVVIPFYNPGDFLAECIDSVIAQSLESWELVLVDDASTDGSLEIARRYCQLRPGQIRVVERARNGGAAAARNLGAAECSSEFILFFDADDLMLPEALARLVGYLVDHADVAAVYPAHRPVGASGQVVPFRRNHWPWARYTATRFVVRRLPPSCPSTPFCSIYLVGAVPVFLLMRTDVYRAAPGWDEDMGQGCEDTDLMLWIALRNRVHHLATELVLYRQHPAQHTRGSDFEAQYRKLHQKWLSMPGLSALEQGIVQDAEWFRTRRFAPCRYALDAWRSGEHGHLARAARQVADAVKSYSGARPPISVSYVSAACGATTAGRPGYDAESRRE